MESFQAKIGWKWLLSFCSVPTRRVREREREKIKQVGKGREREKIKIIVPITSYQIRNREFQKNSKKIKKF